MGTEFTLKHEDLCVGELSPGITKRRWEPEGGIGKHNGRIHSESRFVDHHKNLPFTFSKPGHSKKTKTIRCSSCGYKTFVSVNTVGMICNSCGKYAAVEEVIDG